MKRPELLAPAGNFEKMRAAILYGTDAVYLAGVAFGMRAAADNFSAQELERAGISLISPRFANTNVDLPALPADSYRLVQDKTVYGVMDIGGDDRGAYALGRFAPYIKAENDYRMAFVVNCYRPLTATAEDALEIMREIEAACDIKFNCIVNNSNLGAETVRQTVLDSLDYVNKLCELSGLPLWMHTAQRAVAEQLPELTVLPLTLQKKYFDLPG